MEGRNDGDISDRSVDVLLFSNALPRLVEAVGADDADCDEVV